jgi:hypothetical protein
MLLPSLSHDIPGGSRVRSLIIPITVPVDGPDLVYVPSEAIHFEALGLEPPTYLWLCQDETMQLVAAMDQGSPMGLGQVGTTLYRQNVEDWERYFVGIATGTSNWRWSTGSNEPDLVDGESAAWMFYASVSAGATSTRLLIANGTPDRIEVQSNGVPRTVHNNIATAAAASHSDLTHVRPWVWYRNAAANESGMLTDLEHVIGTHHEGARAVVDRGIGGLGDDAPNLRMCWLAHWKGPAAEQDWKAYLETLGWPLAY